MRRQEACLLALGSVATPLLELQTRGVPRKKVPVDFSRLRSVVLRAVSDASRSAQALVQLRGIWLVTRYVELFDQTALLQIAQGRDG